MINNKDIDIKLETSIKNAKNNHAKAIILGKTMKRLQRELRELEWESGKKNKALRTYMRGIHNMRMEIKNAA